MGRSYMNFLGPFQPCLLLRCVREREPCNKWIQNTQGSRALVKRLHAQSSPVGVCMCVSHVSWVSDRAIVVQTSYSNNVKRLWWGFNCIEELGSEKAYANFPGSIQGEHRLSSDYQLRAKRYIPLVGAITDTTTSSAAWGSPAERQTSVWGWQISTHA